MDQWNISAAKAQFTRVISSSEKEPQIICNRGKPVSAVVHIDLFRELMTLSRKAGKPTIAQLLDELKTISESEPIDIQIPDRQNRQNPFEDEIDEMAL